MSVSLSLSLCLVTLSVLHTPSESRRPEVQLERAMWSLIVGSSGFSPSTPTRCSTSARRAGVSPTMEAGELLLDVKDLRASVEDSGILKGINFQVKRGEVHAIMGPNGSGKSTFSKVLVGHPSYEVTGGTAEYRKGEDLLDLEPEDRAQQGVFLAFQYPVEIAGVSNSDFLRLAVNKRRGALGLPEYDPIEFFGVLAEKMQTVGRTRAAHPYRHPNPRPNPEPNPSPHPNPAPAQVGMSNDFIGRDVNGGFSGGEKKRNEILQVPTPPCAHPTLLSTRGVHLEYTWLLELPSRHAHWPGALHLQRALLEPEHLPPFPATRSR